MKILHATYIYPPTLTVADGITNIVYNVTKELARRGHEVAVYTSNLLDLHSNVGLHAGHLVINGVNVHYSRSLWRYQTFIVTPSLLPSLSKEIDNFDIVHIHDCRSFQGISTYLLAKTRGIPLVFQPHGSYLSSLPDSPTKEIARFTLDNLVSKRIFKGTSRVIAVCNDEVQQYIDAGLPKEKIAIVPNGIDLSNYASLPPKGCFKKKFSIDDDEKILLYLGRIHRIKGLDILVKAFAKVSDELDDVRLVVAGPDDGYSNELHALIETLKIENKVLFSGPLYGRDKLEAYVDSDVYVLPSSYEVWGITVLEAYACGKPVIASRVGGLKDIVINEETGLLVEPSNVGQLAKSIRLLLIDGSDKAKEMGIRGKQFVKENFAVDRIVDLLEHLYKEVVESYSFHPEQAVIEPFEVAL